MATASTSRRRKNEQGASATAAAPPAEGHDPDPAVAAVSGVATAPAELLADVPIDRIAPEPGFNPRQHMDEDELSGLADSIALHGLLQPVLVRPCPDAAGHFLLTGGHRRYEAARRAGVHAIPAIVRRDGDSLIAAVLDNRHRVELTPLEEAKAYERAIKDKGLTPRGVAQAFSVPLKRVTERLRILDTPEPVQHGIAAGVISVQEVGWYADLMARSPMLAMAIGEADVKAGGTLDRQGLQQVIRTTKGIVDAAEIVAGSKAFELRTDEVRAAVDALGKVDAAYSGPDADWRHGPGRGLPQVRRPYGQTQATIVPSDEMLDRGEKVGAVVQIPAGEGWRPVVAVVDPRWLQSELERELVAAHASLREHRRAARSRPEATTSADGEDPAVEREREQRRSERERQIREREDAREVNARLGPALLKHLGAVELTIDSAKALCLLLLKPVETYASTHGDVSAIAGAGLRYVLPDWQVSETSRGTQRPALICDRDELARRFWRWWNAAGTPEEVLGRTLLAFAAVHYADERQALAKERLYGGGLPGHPDARKHLEAVIDAKVPPALRKRRRTTRRKPAQPTTADGRASASKGGRKTSGATSSPGSARSGGARAA